MCEAPRRLLAVPRAEASEAVQGPRSVIQKLKNCGITLFLFYISTSGEYLVLQHVSMAMVGT